MTFKNSSDKESVQKRTVLFVCTHNSAGSPMAEGILRGEKGDIYQVFLH